jgi:hypothetical protein
VGCALATLGGDPRIEEGGVRPSSHVAGHQHTRAAGGLRSIKPRHPAAALGIEVQGASRQVRQLDGGLATNRHTHRVGFERDIGIVANSHKRPTLATNLRN